MAASAWKHFTVEELACPCGCGLQMEDVFMQKVVHMRQSASFPFPVNSGARCKVYDESIDGRGPHRTGRALDIRISGTDAYGLVRLAFLYGMNGIGVKQKGEHGRRFIHIDDLTQGTRPWVWSY